MSQPWDHPMVLNLEPLDWESIALTTRPLLINECSTDDFNRCSVGDCNNLVASVAINAMIKCQYLSWKKLLS